MFMYLFNSDENLSRKQENDSSRGLGLLLIRVETMEKQATAGSKCRSGGTKSDWTSAATLPALPEYCA